MVKEEDWWGLLEEVGVPDAKVDSPEDMAVTNTSIVDLLVLSWGGEVFRHILFWRRVCSGM